MSVLFYFSGFQLDSKRKELTCNGQQIELTKKVYDLLLFLIQNPQQVHTKDDLITHVWHDRIVSGNTIDQTTSKLRKILQDYHEDTFIESIYGQGIKWVVVINKQAPKEKTFKAKSSAGLIGFVAVIFLVLLSIVAYRGTQQTTNNLLFWCNWLLRMLTGK